MSNSWNEGYFTEVGYTYGYYREVSPVYQRFCLLVNGIATNNGEDQAHCELGFGQGVSVNINAAASPGKYYANDFNPEHAAHARNLAEACGNGALLLDDSFEEMLNRNDLPQFDSISMHGIWTWVSRENHKIITDFARKYLKPGGVLYNSYNCFPGWSPAYPLRQLFALYDRFTPTQGGVVPRIDGALKFAESLLEAKPTYADTVTGLSGRLKGIMEHDRNYLAHEYFNHEWNCMYFTDVVDALTPAKLEFAASATPLDLVDEVNLTPEAVAFLEKIDKKILREQVRDYFVNQQFRKDLFMRGIPRLHPNEQIDRLRNTKFLLLKKREDVSMKVKGARGEASLLEAIYMPLLDIMSTNNYAPKSIRELEEALPETGYTRILQAMIVLTQKGDASPCQDEAAAKRAKKACDALNLELCSRAKYGSRIVNLASPVLGGGIVVDRITQLFLYAMKTKHPDPVQFIWKILAAANEVLLKEGARIEGEENIVAELRVRHEKFKNQELLFLKTTGVV